MAWMIILGVLILLAILPLGVFALFDEDGLLVRLILGPIRFTVFPRKKKYLESKTNQKKQATSKSGQKSAKEKRGGDLSAFLPLVNVALQFLDGFRRKLRVNRLEFKLIMAGCDPCDLAIQYGRAWAALGNLMPRLEQVFVIRKRDVEVECDFTSEKSLVLARVDLTITFGRLLWLTLRFGCKALVQYLNIMKLRKGGAKV